MVKEPPRRTSFSLGLMVTLTTFHSLRCDDVDRGRQTVGASDVGDPEYEAESPFFHHERGKESEQKKWFLTPFYCMIRACKTNGL